jgi:hypothetical protein
LTFVTFLHILESHNREMWRGCGNRKATPFYGSHIV